MVSEACNLSKHENKQKPLQKKNRPGNKLPTLIKKLPLYVFWKYLFVSVRVQPYR